MNACSGRRRCTIVLLNRGLQPQPGSSRELHPADLIHSNWQGTRNPFIDHPEWAQAIWAA